jgi:hypothetical protein
VSPIAEFSHVPVAKPASEPVGTAFPPVGSRVLAMRDKTAATVNPTPNLQSLNRQYR